MVKWHPKLYVGVCAGKRLRRLKRLVEKRKFLPDLYLIIPSDKDGEQLELLPVGRRIQLHKPEEAKMVVGIAFGKEEAMDLVSDMAWDVYRATGGCDLKGWFE